MPFKPFRVDDAMLGHLDKLENHPTHYTRTAQEFEIISSSNVEDIKVGDVVKVLATDPSTTRDIPKFCLFLGHELIEQGQAESGYQYLIRKGG